MTDPDAEDPIEKRDRVAKLMRSYYEARCDSVGDLMLTVDNLMLGLLQIVMWEYRHDWPPKAPGRDRHAYPDDVAEIPPHIPEFLPQP